MSKLIFKVSALPFNNYRWIPKFEHDVAWYSEGQIRTLVFEFIFVRIFLGWIMQTWYQYVKEVCEE